MPSTPFDTAHQDSLRVLIGKVLPGAGAQPIAEAVAAGYGFATHEAFGKAIRAVEAGQPAPAHNFDADRLIGRLRALGEPVGEQDETLRFLLAAMSDGPRHGPLAQQRLRIGRLYMQVGLWEHAGTILGAAMSVAPAELKGEVAAALEQAAPHEETAAANLAMALLSADGVTCDAARAASLFDPLTASHEPDLREDAHNWLAHIALGRLGGSPDPAAALSHFEQAAGLGHSEAAFNAGLMLDEGRGVPSSAGKALVLYRRGAELGRPASMTNLAIKVMEHDFDEATALLERAAAAGDDSAAGVLQAWTEMDMAEAAGSGSFPCPARPRRAIRDVAAQGRRRGAAAGCADPVQGGGGDRRLPVWVRQLARAGAGGDEGQGGPAGRGMRRCRGAAPPGLPSARAGRVQRHGARGGLDRHCGLAAHG